MNISLTKELEQWIQTRVEGGWYESPSEVVRESLRLLRERERQRESMVAELRADLLSGCRQMDQGQGVEFTPETLAGIKLAGRNVLSADAK